MGGVGRILEIAHLHLYNSCSFGTTNERKEKGSKKVWEEKNEKNIQFNSLDPSKTRNIVPVHKGNSSLIAFVEHEIKAAKYLTKPPIKEKMWYHVLTSKEWYRSEP
jgi:hypothetical protein